MSALDELLEKVGKREEVSDELLAEVCDELSEYGVSLFRDGYPEKVSEKAWRYVWSIHGSGLSTSVGIHTREMLVDAFTAGHRAGARSARRAGR